MPHITCRVDRSEIYDQTEAKRQPAGRTRHSKRSVTLISGLSSDVAGPSSNNLQKVQVTSARKTPTLKYAAKKNNADQEQRAKTVDIVRLKTGKCAIMVFKDCVIAMRCSSPNSAPIRTLSSSCVHFK